MRNDPRPKFSILGHDAGLVIGGARKTDGTDLYWRIAQFLMPNHAFAPVAMPGEVYYGQCWVPVSDTNCWIYTYSWRPDRAFTNSERTQFAGGFGVHAEVDDDYVPLRNTRNDYLIDRAEAEDHELHRHHRRLRAGRRHPGQPGPDPGPHARASRPDRPRHRRVPQAGHGRGARPADSGEAPKAAQAAKHYAVRSGGWIAAPDKDLATVMTERFGHRHGYVGQNTVSGNS